MMQMMYQTNQQIGFLAQALTVDAQARQANQGYRTLKPKRDITSIECENAEQLMVELMQFEVDLGELGVPVRSEAAFRQLKASCSGKAREVIEEACAYGHGLSLTRKLEMALYMNRPQSERDAAGADLFEFLSFQMAAAVRLNPEKRLSIAEKLYSEARVLEYSVREAENFLRRWRKARYFMHKENWSAQSG
jgi:hypothetical protein